MVPLGGFVGELLFPRLRQRVVLRLAVVLRWLPVGCQPSGFFKTVERRKQRSRLHTEGAVRDLFDAAGDAESVPLSGHERFQDKKIECALKKGLPRCHLRTLLSDVDMTTECAPYSYRMSIGTGNRAP